MTRLSLLSSVKRRLNSQARQRILLRSEVCFEALKLVSLTDIDVAFEIADAKPVSIIKLHMSFRIPG